MESLWECIGNQFLTFAEWNQKWVDPLIGLRRVNSKNGVSTMESVIFYHDIVMGVDRGAEWT